MTSVPFAVQAHALAVHWAPVSHLWPHPPQLFGSLVRLTHVIVLPTMHMLVALTHVQMPPLVPGWHVTPAGQTSPHPLQLFGS
jgi:hypothetical protein